MKYVRIKEKSYIFAQGGANIYYNITTQLSVVISYDLFSILFSPVLLLCYKYYLKK